MMLMLAPVAIIEVVLWLFAFIKLFHAPHTKYLNKIIWAILILLINPIGAIAYLIIENEAYNDKFEEYNN